MEQFKRTFHDLTDHDPFPWQEELFECFTRGNIPTSCQIPTGLGKTAIIPIWLIALARSLDDQGTPVPIPRRLVYIVNRRTVVDQATNEAEEIRKRLDSKSSLSDLLARLKSLCALHVDKPLAISTLRGQFADNREWSADPSRPAIILGTVDMIGSRLLFSGYGLGFKSKPFHAGFLGQDALLVHDEAHLEPAFQQLLVAVKNEQRRCGDFRPFHVMELSATSRTRTNVDESDIKSADREIIRLTAKDRIHPEIKKRIEAKKTVVLHPNKDKSKLVDQLFELAKVHKGSNRTVLVFAQTVESVEKTAAKLLKETPNVVVLTGTMRGKERDELVNKEVFRRFLPGAAPGGETAYLVCTSAGEVGINISSDQLVCDLSTFESMAQRFGRVNRFGDRDDTRIDIVHPEEFDGDDKPYESSLKNTLELLRKLNQDGSPAGLEKLDPNDRGAAFSPLPEIPRTSDILFDAWALTSVKHKMPGRPPVEPYLHGVSTRELPETYVAWREEVEVVTNPLQVRYKPEDLIGDYPIKPHELLRDRSDRVFTRLASLAKKHPEAPVWLLDNDGTVDARLTLTQVADKDRRDDINGKTVILPPKAGGLQNGLLSAESDEADDVADEWYESREDKKRRRIRIRSDNLTPESIPGMRLIRDVDTSTKPDADELDSSIEIEGSEDEEQSMKQGRYWRWYVRPRSADDDGSTTSILPVKWDDHTNQVTTIASTIARALDLSPAWQNAICVAASHHDDGKKRVVWQRGIGNPNPTDWHAKSGKGWKVAEYSDYRHEFGSLLDLESSPDFQVLDLDQKDLVRHIIAAHHGRGRPHFPPDEVFDNDHPQPEANRVAAEVPIRFAQLQRKYGRWGLAYLESLLRAADYAASASPSAFVEDELEDATSGITMNSTLDFRIPLSVSSPTKWSISQITVGLATPGAGPGLSCLVAGCRGPGEGLSLG